MLHRQQELGEAIASFLNKQTFSEELRFARVVRITANRESSQKLAGFVGNLSRQRNLFAARNGHDHFYNMGIVITESLKQQGKGKRDGRIDVLSALSEEVEDRILEKDAWRLKTEHFTFLLQQGDPLPTPPFEPSSESSGVFESYIPLTYMLVGK